MNHKAGNVAFNAQFGTMSACVKLLITIGTDFFSRYAGYGSKYSLLSGWLKEKQNYTYTTAYGVLEIKN
jgi:hypothetical protein